MGLLDGLLKQVTSQVVQSSSQIVKEQVREQASDIAAKKAKEAEVFALKKIIMMQMMKDPANADISEENKRFIEKMVGDMLNHYFFHESDVDDAELANDYNYVTNMIHRGLGKPQTACSTDVNVAMEEFKVAVKELQAAAPKENAAN